MKFNPKLIERKIVLSDDGLRYGVAVFYKDGTNEVVSAMDVAPETPWNKIISEYMPFMERVTQGKIEAMVDVEDIQE